MRVIMHFGQNGADTVDLTVSDSAKITIDDFGAVYEVQKPERELPGWKDEPGHFHCGCENSTCVHAPGSCPVTVTHVGPEGATRLRPWCAYVGEVCVQCAQTIGVLRPSMVSPPYGTYRTPAERSTDGKPR